MQSFKRSFSVSPDVIWESMEMAWAPDGLRETHHSICGSLGRADTPGVMQKTESETKSHPSFKMLMASAKWRLRKAHTLEFNDEAKKKKKSLKLIQLERNPKDTLWQHIK